jgi:hypothetical protein
VQAGLALLTAGVCLLAFAWLHTPSAELDSADLGVASSLQSAEIAGAEIGQRDDEGSLQADREAAASHVWYSYDAIADRLSLRVRNASLREVMEAISERTGLTVETLHGLSLKSRITAEIDGRPLEEVVRDLLSGFNKVFFYHSSDEKGTGTRLASILIISLSQAEAIQQARGDLRDDPTRALVDAVAQSDSAASTLLAKALRSFEPENGVIYPGTDADDEVARDSSSGEPDPRYSAPPPVPLNTAVDGLLGGLDDENVQGYVNTMEILKELAPGKTEAELVIRLQEAEAEGDSQSSVMAAWGLGVVGGSRAVGPLEHSFDGTNEDLRRASANSLQQIRLRDQGQEDPRYLERPPPGTEMDQYAL